MYHGRDSPKALGTTPRKYTEIMPHLYDSSRTMQVVSHAFRYLPKEQVEWMPSNAVGMPRQRITASHSQNKQCWTGRRLETSRSFERSAILTEKRLDSRRLQTPTSDRPYHTKNRGSGISPVPQLHPHGLSTINHMFASSMRSQTILNFQFLVVSLNFSERGIEFHLPMDYKTHETH
jgi:hypothetical protein